MQKFKHAGLGGTFDRFHRGHQELINTALNSAEKISIGVTTSKYVQNKKFSNQILPYRQRVSDLESYLESIKAKSKVSIFPLKDVYGPTLERGLVDCLIVTAHTLPGANLINQKRSQLGFSLLPIIKAKLIKDQSGSYISSTRIRLGEIDRQGFIYQTCLGQTIIISAAVRDKLKSPHGQIIRNQDIIDFITHANPTVISAVGDQTLSTLLKHKVNVAFGIFDDHIMRKPSSAVINLLKSLQGFTITNADNPAGSIDHQTSNLIFQKSRLHGNLLRINGEEDVLVMPLVLALPLGSVVIYGQPNQGMVAIMVTEQTKQSMVNLITY